MITIYETGLIDFSDLGLVKPVKVTEDDLRMIASSTDVCDITEEHTDKVVGSLSNFIVEDGRLKTNEPKDLDYSGKGFSPRIHCDELVDMGDFYSMKGMSMINVGLAAKPRTKILYNSISSNGDNGMSDNDEQFRKLVDDNRQLTEEIGSLKTQLTNVTKQLDSTKKDLEEAKKTNTQSEEDIKKFEAFKKKAEAYDSIIENERQELIKKVTNGDESKAERYASFTNEQLGVFLEDKGATRNPRGVDPTQTNTQDGGSPNPDNPDDDYYDWDDFESDFEALGL